jgi:hypothetical protein
MPRRWSELSDRTRKLIVVGAAAETVLKVAMLIDIRRRPASQIRGSKRIWAATALLNSAGIGPMAYFAVGRRR